MSLDKKIYSSINGYIINVTDSRIAAEREEEFFRKEEFKQKYAVVSRIPLIGKLSGETYSLGIGAVTGVLIALTIFTLFKVQYFNVPFTGEHPMKYSAFAGPAINMVEKNNILWYQNRYKVDPIHNPEGVNQKFSDVPVMEWGLFLTYKLFPTYSYEESTRLFLHFIGVLILIFSFLFLKKWIPKEHATIFVLLLSINPIFSFSTFVTVLDSIIILLMFLSLMVLNGYFDSRKIKTIFISGLIFGVGNAIKYSLFIWFSPMILILFYLNKKSRGGLYRDLVLFHMLGVLPIIAKIIVEGKIFSSPQLAIIILSGWAITFAILYKIIQSYEDKINNFFENITLKKTLLFIYISAFFLIGAGAFHFLGFGRYVEKFLTDRLLIFNASLYKYMLLGQFKKYMTENLFILGSMGFLLLPFAIGSKFLKITLSLVFGSIIYWILASKVIFFHKYYTLIFMILFCLSSATFIYLFATLSKRKYRFAIYILVALFILPSSYKANSKRLGYFQDISALRNYIVEHTKDDEIIYNQSGVTSLDIYIKRGVVWPCYLENTQVRQSIHDYGFADTMEKYKIKYLITTSSGPKYIEFSPLFSKIKNPSLGTKRDYLIFKRLGLKNKNIDSIYTNLKLIATQENIGNKFSLEKKIGKFKIFTFKN